MSRRSWNLFNLLAAVLLAAPVAAQDPVTPPSGPPAATTPLKPAPPSNQSEAGRFLDESRKAAERLQGLSDGTIKLGGSEPSPVKPAADTDAKNHDEMDAAKKVFEAMGRKTIGLTGMQTLASVEQKLGELLPGFQPAPASANDVDRVKTVEEAVKKLGPEARARVEGISADFALDRRIGQLSTILGVHEADLEHAQRTQRSWFQWGVIGGLILLAVGGFLVTRVRHRTKSVVAGERDASAPAAVSSPADLQPAEPAKVGPVAPATPARKAYRLFISFSSSDLDFVQHQLAPALREAGHEPWFSKVSIRPSDEWERSILAALRECDWFLVVMSPNALKSKWVQLEVHWATEHREGRILPLMLERCDPWQLHMKLGNLQHVNCARSSEAMAEIVRLIEAKEAERAAAC